MKRIANILVHSYTLSLKGVCVLICFGSVGHFEKGKERKAEISSKIYVAITRNYSSSFSFGTASSTGRGMSDVVSLLN